MKRIIIAAAALAALAAVPAAAQAQAATNVGAYVNLGYGYTDTPIGNLHGLQGRLGYRFNDWIGAEGEIGTGIKSDDVNIAGTDVNVKLKHQLAAYVVGFAPVGANTDVFARIGYGESKIRARSGGVSFSDDGSSVNYGVGAQHHFDGLNGVRIDWTRHDFTNGGDKADVFAIAYSRRF